MSVTYIPSHPSYYICPLTTLSGVYATTLLVVLNSRIKYNIKTHMTTLNDNPSHTSFPMRHVQFDGERGANAPVRTVDNNDIIISHSGRGNS